MTRELDEAGRALLKHWEQGPHGGVALAAYNDGGGVWTIGWGHTAGVKPMDTCSLADAERWFDEDTHWARDVVEEMIHVPLTDNQFAALVCWTFNVGEPPAVASTLVRQLNAGQYAEVPAQLGRWIWDNGRVVEGLRNRRRAEVELWLKP